MRAPYFLMMSFAAVLLFANLSFAAEVPENYTNSITAIDFYPYGAKFSFRVEPYDNEKNFKAVLPGSFNADSIRLINPEDVEGDIRIEKFTRERWIPSQLAALKSELDELEKEISRLDAKKSALEQTLEMLKNFEPEKSNPEALLNYIKDSQALRLETENELVALKAEITRKQAKQKILSAELNSRRPSGDTSYILITGKTMNYADFSAFTPAASWYPKYILDLDSSSGKIEADLFVRASQKTGLDYKGDVTLQRQYMAVRQALELNVGEIFLLNKNDFNAAKAEVEKILKDSGMQELRVNDVLATFEKVLSRLPRDNDQAEDDEDFEPTQTISTNKKVKSAEEKVTPPVEPKPSVEETARPEFNIVESPPPQPSPPVQPVPPPPPTPPVQPPPQIQTPPPQPQPQPVQSSSSNNKLLIGVIVVLIAVIGYMMKDDSSDNRPPEPVQQATEQPQPVQEKPAETPKPPPIREAYLDAKTDMSLNGVDIGLSRDELISKWGNPKEIEENGRRYVYPAIRVGIVDNKVHSLITYDSSYKTKRGLHVGSTYAEVVSAYGSSHHEMEKDGLILHEYDFNTLDGQAGLLRFAINKSDGHVNYISIRIPDPEPPKPEPPKSNVDENAKAAARAFVSYHEAITNENFQRAYDLMTEQRKNFMGNGMADFRKGYETTISSEITELNLLSSSPDRVLMSYTLDARDRAKGGTLYRQFQGEVEMVKIGGEWKINDVHSKKTKEVMER